MVPNGACRPVGEEIICCPFNGADWSGGGGKGLHASGNFRVGKLAGYMGLHADDWLACGLSLQA